MTPLKYITDPSFGCATIAEVMALGKSDPAALATLKAYAKVEMANRGIPVEEPVKA